MNLLLAIVVQVLGVAAVAAGAGFWFGWPATLAVVGAFCIYVGHEMEKSG